MHEKSEYHLYSLLALLAQIVTPQRQGIVWKTDEVHGRHPVPSFAECKKPARRRTRVVSSQVGDEELSKMPHQPQPLRQSILPKVDHMRHLVDAIVKKGEHRVW